MKKLTKADPKLYILVRTDMASLTPGKAMAQVAHAANLCERMVARSKNKAIKDAWKVWEGNRGFGTTIVLDGDDLLKISVFIHGYTKKYVSGFVKDPTYPLTDGKVTHLIDVITAGFYFDPDPKERAPFPLLSKTYSVW